MEKSTMTEQNKEDSEQTSDRQKVASGRLMSRRKFLGLIAVGSAAILSGSLGGACTPTKSAEAKGDDKSSGTQNETLTSKNQSKETPSPYPKSSSPTPTVDPFEDKPGDGYWFDEEKKEWQKLVDLYLVPKDLDLNTLEYGGELYNSLPEVDYERDIKSKNANKSIRFLREGQINFEEYPFEGEFKMFKDGISLPPDEAVCLSFVNRLPGYVPRDPRGLAIAKMNSPISGKESLYAIEEWILPNQQVIYIEYFLEDAESWLKIRELSRRTSDGIETVHENYLFNFRNYATSPVIYFGKTIKRANWPIGDTLELYKTYNHEIIQSWVEGMIEENYDIHGVEGTLFHPTLSPK